MANEGLPVDKEQEAAWDVRNAFNQLLETLKTAKRLKLTVTMNLGTSVVKLSGTERIHIEHTREL